MTLSLPAPVGDALAVLTAIPGWVEVTALALILAFGIITATVLLEVRRRALAARDALDGVAA